MTQHPSIVISDEVRKELLTNLNKKELIEEVEWLKRQREELLLELQRKNTQLREYQLNEESD